MADFQWAMQQMLKGNRVKLDKWSDGMYWRIEGLRFFMGSTVDGEQRESNIEFLSALWILSRAWEISNNTE